MAQKFALDILSCPPSGAIKAIVYTTPTKLAVIEGANTLMSIDLKDFFMSINNAQQTTFTLPGMSATNSPLLQYSFTYCGLNDSATAKFAAFFPQYPSKGEPTTEYIEWTFLNEITDENLSILPPILIDNSGSTAGATGSDTSYQLNYSKDILRVSGTSLGLISTDAYAICTRGGLKIWSMNDPMMLFNTYNSKILSNDIRCITTNPTNMIWVGTDKGISSLSWSSSGYAFSNITVSDGIISNIIQDIFYLNDNIAIATDIGISLYNTVTKKVDNFSKLNVNEIDIDSFTSIKIDGTYVIAGSESGVFVYNMITENWSKYDSNITGWSNENYINVIESYNNEVFAGTTGGIVTFTIGATSCVTLVNSLTGPYENITGLIYSVGTGATGDEFLYVSHGGPTSNGAISAYDIIGGTWSFGITGNISSPLFNGTTQLAFHDDLYFTNSTGFAKFATASQFALPLSSQKGDILFSYPANNTFPVALNQKIYIGTSKNTANSTLQSHFSIKNETTGATLSYSLNASDNIYDFTFNALQYANQYTFSLFSGLTATDSTFFRQSIESSFYAFDKNPISGWKIAGKQLLLSGAESNYITPIVFRNPQSFDVNVLTLVAV